MMHNRMVYCLGACLTICLLGAAAQADDVKAGNLWYQKVRVTGLREGKLLYAVRGANRDLDLKDLNGLKLDAHPEYDQADQAIADGKFDQAITLLNKLMGELGRRESYLRPLVLARLVAAYDGAGQFGDALDKYLELVREDDNAFFVAAAPKNLPADADVRKRASQLIKGSLDAAKPGAKAALEQLLASLAQPAAAVTTPATTEPAPTTPATGAGAQPAAAQGAGARPADATPTVEVAELTASTDDVARVHRDLEAKKYDAALKSINILKTRRNAPLPELFFAEGVAFAGLNKPLDAAIAFMRVAVHFPDSPQAVPSLIQAGEMLKAAGKTDEARRVWTDAAGRTQDAALRRQIGELLRSAGS